MVVIRYHEVALKGRNRPFFVRCLAENVARATADLPVGPVRRGPARLFLGVAPDAWPAVRERLGEVFGIANFSLSRRTALEIDAMAEAVVSEVAGRSFGSFRIQTRRANKAFPLTSPEINRIVGARVQAATGARVDLDGAELTVSIEVLSRAAYFSVEKVAGPGGLPVGVSGHVLALLSGGIDSPVAARRMMRRGCRVSFVHFHSVPFLDRTSQEKVRELAARLTRHQYATTLYLVPFGEIQRQIVAAVRRPYRVVLYRRMMLRIAEALARAAGAEALVTGESLGQVASQTLPNLAVIGSVVSLPLLRPLVGMDKSEIVAEAQRAGTFATSIVPDQDCCQLFVPRHPATRARAEEVERAEAAVDIPALVRLGVEGAQRVEFSFPAHSPAASRVSLPSVSTDTEP